MEANRTWVSGRKIYPKKYKEGGTKSVGAGKEGEGKSQTQVVYADPHPSRKTQRPF